MVRKLSSNASRSRTRLGVSMASIASPGRAAGGMPMLACCPTSSMDPLRTDRKKKAVQRPSVPQGGGSRSEEHTSELQSLMRISYAVFCLKQKRKHINRIIQRLIDAKA